MPTAAPAPQYRHYASKAAAAPDMGLEAVQVLSAAIDERGEASIALTGGSSPAALYEELARAHAESLDWGRVHVFLGDERAVPHAHEDSNMRTCAPLLDGLPFHADHLHPWRTDLAPAAALADMRAVLAKAGLGKDATAGGRGIDLVLLGVGPDGHVASLFPHDAPWEALGNPDADDVHYLDDSPKPPPERFTFTLPFLNRGAHVWLMPFGSGKAEALEGFRQNDASLPVSHVRGRASTTVWTDLPTG